MNIKSTQTQIKHKHKVYPDITKTLHTQLYKNYTNKTIQKQYKTWQHKHYKIKNDTNSTQKVHKYKPYTNTTQTTIQIQTLTT